MAKKKTKRNNNYQLRGTFQYDTKNDDMQTVTGYDWKRADIVALARQAGYKGPNKHAAAFMYGTRDKKGQVFKSTDAFQQNFRESRGKINKVLDQYGIPKNSLDPRFLQHDTESAALLQKHSELVGQRGFSLHPLMVAAAPFVVGGLQGAGILGVGTEATGTFGGLTGADFAGVGGLEGAAGGMGTSTGAFDYGFDGTGIDPGSGVMDVGPTGPTGPGTDGAFDYSFDGTGIDPGSGTLPDGTPTIDLPGGPTIPGYDPIPGGTDVIKDVVTKGGTNVVKDVITDTGGDILDEVIGNVTGDGFDLGKFLQTAGLGDMAKGIFDFLAAQDTEDTIMDLADMNDPFRDQRAFYQGQQRALWEDPNWLQNNAGFQAGINAVNRRNAGLGQMFSGNNAADLINYGMMKQMDFSKTLDIPSGATIQPSYGQFAQAIGDMHGDRYKAMGTFGQGFMEALGEWAAA